MNAPNYPPVIRAETARQLSEKQLKGVLLGPVLSHVHERICRAALQGQREVYHPFYGMPKEISTTSAIEKAVWSHLTEAGYTVDHRPDPDPGHPASGPYTVISW